MRELESDIKICKREIGKIRKKYIRGIIKGKEKTAEMVPKEVSKGDTIRLRMLNDWVIFRSGKCFERFNEEVRKLHTVYNL